ncbi:hypothetical protein TCE0_042r14999 [Talaromyces pinophilus]|uniref:Uncharacterized protein n=1 Tax=Talaromyces pinophilus TaxID=128442 RepID=A0A6V8HIN4_TALPI|nr:hypothetical protein TCE0_042r14999 [Talaromyces pinophilus]
MAKEELAALNKGLADIPPVPEGDSDFDELSGDKMELDSGLATAKVAKAEPALKKKATDEEKAAVKRRLDEALKAINDARELGVELPGELANEPPIKKQRCQSPDLPPEAAAYKKRLGEELDSLIEDIKKDRERFQWFCDKQKKMEEEIEKLKGWKAELSTRIGRKQKEIRQKKRHLKDIDRSHRKSD